MVELRELGESLHEVVNGDNGIPFRLEDGAILSESEFLEPLLFLQEALIVEADGKDAFHGKTAEL